MKEILDTTNMEELYEDWGVDINKLNAAHDPCKITNDWVKCICEDMPEEDMLEIDVENFLQGFFK